MSTWGMGCQKNSENYQRLLWMTPVSLLQHHRLKLERQECNCFSGVDFHEQNRTKSYECSEIISGEAFFFSFTCIWIRNFSKHSWYDKAEIVYVVVSHENKNRQVGSESLSTHCQNRRLFLKRSPIFSWHSNVLW